MLQAMKNAFTNLLKKPYTHPYPTSPIEKPENYRGLIEYDESFCIFCDKCEKVCPPGAILFEVHEDKTKTYNYSPYLCIYCGDCVSACPKSGEALKQSENKALPSSKNVNDEWFEVEKITKQSRKNAKIKKQST